MMQRLSTGFNVLYKIFLIVLFNAVCIFCHAAIFFMFANFPLTGDSIAIGVLLGQIWVTKYIWKESNYHDIFLWKRQF